MTIEGSIYHLTTKGWEGYTGAPHQRPLEFKDATEAREYLAGRQLMWPGDMIDKWLADPDQHSFLGTHEIKPFEGLDKL